MSKAISRQFDLIFTGQPSQMYVTRSQTEDSKLDYSAYSSQQSTGTQHLAQQTNYLSESDFGSHVSVSAAAPPTSAKEEPTLFSVTSQPPQQSPLASTPTDNDQQQQQQQQQDQQPQQNPDGTVTVPTLADYNQSTSKGHEILSQVSLLWAHAFSSARFFKRTPFHHSILFLY